MLNEFHDLERKHQIVKEQYEAEIMRLKGQSPPNPSPGAAPATAVQGQGPSSAVQTSQIPQTSPVNPAKRRAGMPDASAQIPSYSPTIPSEQHTLPTMFGSRGMSHHQPNQQGQPGSQLQPGQGQPGQPGQTGVPPSAQQGQGPPSQPPGAPIRLMGISSLPPAPVAAAGNAASIPAMNAGGPGVMSRGPTGGLGNKMPSMSLMPPNGNTPARDSNAISHAIKKDPSLSMAQNMSGGAGLAGPGGNGVFGASVPRPPTMGSRAPGATPSNTGGEEDWAVYQGRTANGSLVNMKVSLQHSLTLDSVVCCVRYSWDGQYLATGSNRSAHIFDATTGQSVATFSKDTSNQGEDASCSDSYVRAVCFSPDGNWLITGAEDHVVKVWDVRNRKVKHRLVGHGTDIYSVDASANSQFIISGSGDKKAKLWSLESGKLLSTLGGEFGPTDGITSVSVSPTSQHVAAGSLDKVVRVWDVESSRLVRQFEGHRDSVYSVAFSPDGRMLLSGSLDKTLKLWDLAASQPSSQCRLSFTGHKDFVLSVAFSPNGRWLISGSKDRSVQFWDPRQSTMCLMLQGHKNSVISIAHNPVSPSLATGSGDCRARTWMYALGG